MKKYFFAFGILLLSLYTQAQVRSPKLQCVNADNEHGTIHLHWTDANTAATCGSFLGYHIYGAQSYAGPYSLIFTETNPAITSYTHTGVSGVWYYYIETECAFSGISPSSDTIDSAQPLTPPLTRVTVENGHSRLYWTPSPSPETAAYLIFWQGPIGLVIVDTVYGHSNTSYLHLTSRPDLHPEIYTITSMDSCGETGLPSPVIHQTIRLQQTAEDPCARTLTLQWSAYRGWDSVAQHQIWVGRNGSSPVLFARVGAGTNSFVYPNAHDGDTLCFTIHALKGVDTLLYSASNEVCLVVAAVRPMDFAYVKNASVNGDNSVTVHWIWDTDVDLKTAQLQRADSPTGSYSVVQPYTAPLMATDTFTDLMAQAGAAARFYQVQTTDRCDTVFSSNSVGTIHLEVKALDHLINRLNWTRYRNPYAEVLQYRVYRDLVGSSQLIGTTVGSFSSFNDHVDGSDTSQQVICYRVVADLMLRLPDTLFLPETMTSQSNTACAEQSSTLFMPNAFAPGSPPNEVFKPATIFTHHTDYLLQVYSRWGEKVFESTNPDLGWDGSVHGKPAPQGIYGYLVSLKQQNGRLLQKQGTVMLIR